MTDSRSAPPFVVDGDASLTPGPVSLRNREAYYLLVNVEEHPEVLPLASDVVAERLGAASGLLRELQSAYPRGADAAAALTALTDHLDRSHLRFSRPWRQDSADLTRRQVLHFYSRYLPTALVDGCWLQCGFRVGTAFTPLGAQLTGLYAHQVRAYVSDPGQHFVADYRAAFERLSGPLEEVSSHSLTDRADLDDGCFGLPVFLLGIAQYTQAWSAEILGLNLAWQFLRLTSFGPDLIQDLCEAYALPPLGMSLGDADHHEKGRRLAREAAVRFLELDHPDPEDAWARLLCGVASGLQAWTAWFDGTAASAPTGPPDPRQEMIDLLWRKAPHATGYHSDKALGDRRIDEHLAPATFDGPAILDELARSRWVQAGRSDRSALVKGLVKFGGPMLAVFTAVEIQIMQNWIDSLPPKDASGSAPGVRAIPGGAPAATVPSAIREEHVLGRAWTRPEFQRRSQKVHGECTTRELFYHLTNIERYPDILPIAERYARDRLERSMAMLWKGERPIPSRHYDPAALERWVYKKHREQVDAYRPPAVRPPVPKDAFIEVTVQLAPIVLIDGGWLQGIASPALIHTTVGRMLFHVLVEEIGAGDHAEHHANIYRDLLAAMGEDAPPVDSWEFARWSRLKDSSFDVPTLWLAISCFPRHFLPEIIGLNLAVELAGIGGPYMEARDTLRGFGYPTLFVDVHNAADNVAAGHSAWAMNTIKRYLDDVAEREGPHNVDHAWHRVWAGVRSTLPQIGRLRLMAHRIGKRFLGADPSVVPLIFPS